MKEVIEMMKEINRKVNILAIFQIAFGFYMCFSSILIIRDLGMSLLELFFLFIGANAMLRGFKLLVSYYGALSDMKKEGKTLFPPDMGE